MSRQQGFTLVEILVALTLFGAVGGMLLQLFGSGLNNTRTAADMTHAALLVRSKLTELQATSGLAPGTMDGEQDGFTWQAVISEPAEPPFEGFATLEPLDLRLTVRWGQHPDERQLAVSSVVLTTFVADR